MLPRSLRLQHASDIEKMFKQGRRVPCGPIMLFIKPNQLQHSRFGCIAGKKTFPLATERNAAKRIAREAVRLVSSRVCPGYDILILYRSRPLTRNVLRFRSALEACLERAGFLVNN